MSEDQTPDDQKLRLGGWRSATASRSSARPPGRRPCARPTAAIRVESGRGPARASPTACRSCAASCACRRCSGPAGHPAPRCRRRGSRSRTGTWPPSTLFCAALATVVKRRGGFRSEVARDPDRDRPVVRDAAQPRARALPRGRAQDGRGLRGGRRRAEAPPRSTTAAARTSSRRCCSAGRRRGPSRRGRPRRRAAPVGALGSLAAVGFAFELFAWRERHPGSLGARALSTARHGDPAGARNGGARRGRARGRRARARGAARRGGFRSGRVSALPGVRGRLPSEVFDLPVEKMREGYYSDAYFNFTKQVLERDGHHPRVLMQVFQRHHVGARRHGRGDRRAARVRGPRRADGAWQPGWDELVVHALHDGDEIEPWETVMTIEGDYSLFCHLETVYLGALSRRTLIARNVREVVRRRARQADPLLPGPPRPLPRADRRRLRRAHRGRDRRLDRRAGLVVGRARASAPCRTA